MENLVSLVDMVAARYSGHPEIHLYVEGQCIPVSRQRALEMVEAGTWERCDHKHHLDPLYDGLSVVVYHAASHRKALK